MERKMTLLSRGGLLAGTALLGACTVMPSGPNVMVLPGTGQSIERFRDDDASCRQFAFIQIGGKTAEAAARESAVTSAAVGTAVGAVAGAAIGGNSHWVPRLAPGQRSADGERDWLSMPQGVRASGYCKRSINYALSR
jgi:hypothetical protein